MAMSFFFLNIHSKLSRDFFLFGSSINEHFEFWLVSGKSKGFGFISQTGQSYTLCTVHTASSQQFLQHSSVLINGLLKFCTNFIFALFGPAGKRGRGRS